MNTVTCMRAYAAVVDQGNFTKAADHLGIAKALVSKYVGQLEDHLGTRLLNRTTRSVSVTEAGRIYHDRCLQLLEDLDELELSVQARDATPGGNLRVTAATVFGEMYFTDVIAGFLKAQPSVEIELTLTDRYVNIIEEGYDLALRIGEMDDSSLIARKLGAFRMVTCASPEYLARNTSPVHPFDLSDQVCILDTNLRTKNRWPYIDNGKPINVPVRGHFQVNTARSVRDMTLRGQGIGRCPAYVVGKDLKQGRLNLLLQDYEVPEQGIYAVYPHRRHLAAKIRTFVDFIQSSFKNDSPWVIC